MRRFWKPLRRVVNLAIGVSLTIAAWEAFVRITGISQLTLPSPGRVWAVTLSNREPLIDHGLATLGSSLAAFAIAALSGIFIACLIAQWERVRRLLLPFIVSLQAAPKIALAPLLVLWIGFGRGMAVVVGVLVAIFPMIINTVIGLQTVDSDMLMMARTMRARETQIFTRIRLPFAMPHIVSGLKNCLMLSVIGVVVGELTGANSGLGFVLLSASAQFRMDYAFAATIILMLMGIILFYILEGLESRFAWYQREVARNAMALRGGTGVGA